MDESSLGAAADRAINWRTLAAPFQAAESGRKPHRRIDRDHPGAHLIQHSQQIIIRKGGRKRDALSGQIEGGHVRHPPAGGQIDSYVRSCALPIERKRLSALRAPRPACAGHSEGRG